MEARSGTLNGISVTNRSLPATLNRGSRPRKDWLFSRVPTKYYSLVGSSGVLVSVVLCQYRYGTEYSTLVPEVMSSALRRSRDKSWHHTCGLERRLHRTRSCLFAQSLDTCVHTAPEPRTVSNGVNGVEYRC